jgi:hypothetical protein
MLAAMRRASSRLAARSMGFVILVICGDPVLGDGFLYGSKIELLIADHFARQVLQSVLGLGIPRDAARFPDPEGRPGQTRLPA